MRIRKLFTPKENEWKESSGKKNFLDLIKLINNEQAELF